ESEANTLANDISSADEMPSPEGSEPPARILLADDNADMREYVKRILSQRWKVETVADGKAALDASREQQPDLVLADGMMPRLDGLGLLRERRWAANTQDVRVILLAARGGEESRVEGLIAGADDYLLKPFSARELIARIQAHLNLARLRREATLEMEAARRRTDEILSSISDA